jgi:hypothetical protein
MVIILKLLFQLPDLQLGITPATCPANAPRVIFSHRIKEVSSSRAGMY